MPLLAGLFGRKIAGLTWVSAAAALAGVGLLESSGAPPAVSHCQIVALLSHKDVANRLLTVQSRACLFLQQLENFCMRIFINFGVNSRFFTKMDCAGVPQGNRSVAGYSYLWMVPLCRLAMRGPF